MAGFSRQPNPTRADPTIAAEFVSSGRRNWKRESIERRDEYLETDLKEFWIINRFQRNMSDFRRMPEGWDERTIHESETYRTDRLPGFELPVGRVLAVADRSRVE